MTDAYAADELLSAQEIKLCLGVEQCQSSADFLTPELKQHLGILPKPVAKSQIDLISKSYTVVQFNRFRKGVDPIQKFDLNRVQDEILKHEGQAEKLSSALINRKLLTPASFDGFEKQTVEKDYAWYAPEMKPGFADVKLASSNFGNIPLPLPIDITETSTSDLLDEFKTEENGDTKKFITADDDPNDLRASMEKNTRNRWIQNMSLRTFTRKQAIQSGTLLVSDTN